ncbi:hypothetical protein BK121_03355 [Paenibacillus odorifer]|uniref:hypothetical protein n=1 Tax=Paenibacillus odorifer TaxID=189426 RepID=UPI00096FFED4|nr:hypothetical protein [Paenibacillus odorifer]OMC75064.1 hypothetical protein BK121_03355 [Paenibacillus odorifer]
MHHTVHMFYKFDYQYYSAIFTILQEICLDSHRIFFKDTDKSWQFHLLKDKGLLLILRHNEYSEGISYHALEIIMNPMRLLQEDDYYNLAESKYSKQIYKEFKRAFTPIRKKFKSKKSNKNLIFKFDNLDIYSFKRIDFAINICTDYVDLYMKLIKRADIPNGFQLYAPYDNISRRSKPPEDSFYIFRRSTSKGNHVTLTINCYKKGVQMIDNALPEHELSAKTIRFEVQCRYSKVYSIIRSNGLSKQGYSQFLDEVISTKVLDTYIKKTIGYGDYYTLPKAKSIVEGTKLKLETKNALITTLEQVNEKRSIWKAKEASADQKKFIKSIKKLHEIGINPVTIPIAEKVDYLSCFFDINNQI